MREKFLTIPFSGILLISLISGVSRKEKTMYIKELEELRAAFPVNCRVQLTKMNLDEYFKEKYV